eukprot:SAG11_NODE_1622_length_4561_cov_2.741820_1_plen_1115_part_00
MATAKLALVLALACGAVAVPSVELFVDSGSIRSGAPANMTFSSLSAARDAVRVILQRHRARGIDVTVTLLGGDHRVEALVLGPSDSGTAGHPVVWQAAAQQEVLISGGLPIPAAAFKPWPAGPAGALAVNLTALGISDLGCLAGGGGDKDQHTDSNGISELFWQSEPAVLARWPNLYPNGSNHWAYTAGGAPANCSCGKPTCPGAACEAFAWRNDSVPARAATWQSEIETRRRTNSQLPTLHGYWTWDWRDGYVQMAQVNASAGLVYGPSAAQLTRVSLGARWHALDLQCELDAPGEYWIDRGGCGTNTNSTSPTQGMLYFVPPPPSGAADLSAGYISVADSVLSLQDGASFISFRGLRFAHSRGTIIQTAPNASVSNITFTNCTISQGGGSGISIKSGRGVVVESTEIYGVASTALEIRGGYHRSLTRGDNIIRWNYIHHYARFFRTYRPGVLWAGVGNLFEHNHIAHAPHNAFLGGGNEAVCNDDRASGGKGENDTDTSPDEICGGNDNIFQYNLVEHVCYETDDSGAFYSCGQEATSYVQRGNIIRSNTFKHVRMVDEIHLGNPVVQGVYLDDGMTGYKVYNNTFIDCQNGLLFNGGRDNYVYDNYFQDVDFVAYLGGECKDTETYSNLVAASKWPAWLKYRTQLPAMTVPPTFAAFSKLSCVAGGNQFKGNEYCRVKDAFFKGSPDAKNASVVVGNIEKCRPPAELAPSSLSDSSLSRVEHDDTQGVAADLVSPPHNPFAAEPYPVFWAVHGPNASAFGADGSINIAQYSIKNHSFTVCGGMLGSVMPTLSPDGEPNINGGVPQAANLSVFLDGLAANIQAIIPGANYAGLAVFDFEAYTPLWSEDTGAGGWHGKAYRDYSVKLVQDAHPSWSTAQVEAEAKMLFEAAAIEFFVAALQKGKALRPKAQWGFYGMPYVHPNANASKLLSIWQASDVLFPSIYLASPNTAAQVVQQTVELSLAMATEAAGPGQRRKQVYPFAWECWHNGSTLLDQKDAILDFLSPYNYGADGLVVWGDAGGGCAKGLSCMCDPAHGGPTHPSYFENIQQQTGPLIKDFEARVAACSAAHCSGHGRCEHVPEVKLPPSTDAIVATCVCFEGFSGPACAAAEQN